MIYLNNGIEFYPIELVAFVIKKSIYLKPIVLRASNQNGPIERTEKTIIDQICISFIANGFLKGYWLYIEEAAVYIINFISSFANPDSVSLYERWACGINFPIEYIKPSIRTFCIQVYKVYIYIGNEKLRPCIRKMMPTVYLKKLYGYEGIYSNIYIVCLDNG